MNEPKHLDLFSGIGGFSIAAESVGFKTIGFSEIDLYASRVLQKSWPHVPNFGDVRNITRDTVKDVTLITGGFPCQPFSVAGKKLGDSDERHLWPELVRILSEIRPRYALFENVPGLLSISGGRIFNGVLSDLCKIGYDCLWNLVPASAVGANHQRDRLWIVAYTQGPGVLREPKNICEENGRQDRQMQGESVSPSNVAYPISKRGCGGNGEWENASHVNPCSKDIRASSNPDWWTVEPNVGRVANGIPNRTHRLRCLGNAIVPQVAQIFLKEIYNQVNQFEPEQTK